MPKTRFSVSDQFSRPVRWKAGYAGWALQVRSDLPQPLFKAFQHPWDTLSECSGTYLMQFSYSEAEICSVNRTDSDTAWWPQGLAETNVTLILSFPCNVLSWVSFVPASHVWKLCKGGSQRAKRSFPCYGSNGMNHNDVHIKYTPSLPCLIQASNAHNLHSVIFKLANTAMNLPVLLLRFLIAASPIFIVASASGSVDGLAAVGTALPPCAVSNRS